MSDNEILISERVHYRQRELEKVLAEIENEIAGRNVSFRALITDEKGEVDPKKVDRMIDEMVNNLGNDIYGYSRVGETITEDEKEFYRCFLYCCMFGPGPRSAEEMIWGYFAIPETFLDIINVAKEGCLKLETEEELAYLRDGCGADGDVINCIGQFYFFRIMDMARSWLVNGIPEDPKNPDDYFTLEEADSLCVDLDLERSYYESYINGSKWENVKWFESVPDKKKLVEMYDDFKELYFKVDHMNIDETVQDMVDAYLLEKGIAPLSLGASYGLIDDTLKKSIIRLRRTIERARELS